MEELKKRVQQRAKKNPTNVFLGYSGHGTSIKGQLFITLPTKLTQEEYMNKSEDLSVPIAKLPVDGSDLKRFRELREKIGRNFLEKTFDVQKKLNEEDKKEM